MARPLRIEFKGAFYHITARGNERKDIFRDNADREKLLCYFESAVERYQAVIHAFCLMDNHYHLLIETPAGNLSQTMRHINGAFTAYFNRRHQRAGHLFQGRYKAILVEADEYAGALSRYIHLNPVRAGLVDRPEKYPWSSYRYYAGAQKAPWWCTIEWLLQYFGKGGADAQRAYRGFVKSETDAAVNDPLKETVAAVILGSAEFIGKVKELYLSGRKGGRDIPALKALTRRSIEEIINVADQEFGAETELSRKAALYLSHRHSGLSLREIGRYFGIGESAVSQASRRFGFVLEKDVRLQKKLKQMKRTLQWSNV
ncbi:MAG: transposase [Nitrospirota bacterium]